MSQPIRGQGGHLVFPIGPKNTNLVEDVEILLSVKFCWILFSGFRGKVEKVSANQRPGWPSCFSADKPEKHKLGRGRWDLAPCQVKLNSVQQFQRSRKCLSQSEAGRPSCFSDQPEKHKLLNVLYQVCVFQAYRQKNKMATLVSDWLRLFRLFLWNRWTKFNKTWQKARSQRPLPSLCFSGWSEKQDGRPASDWLRHFRLLWNCWTEFNLTWQGARSQRPLPSLCFSGRLEKQDGRPGLWLAETFLTSPLKPLNRIQQNLTGSKITASSTKFVFFRPIGKTRWLPWPLIGWDIFDFSSETAERNST